MTCAACPPGCADACACTIVEKQAAYAELRRVWCAKYWMHVAKKDDQSG
jgi:hypothetical protein